MLESCITQQPGVPRVQGVLALSRVMGDFELNPYVTCDPQLVSIKIENED